jgi:glycosyltransferase involved in cell wall biosynthesis
VRVLWFSNCQITGNNRDIGCSWIGSLEAQISKMSDIRLGISFNTKDPDSTQFNVGTTTFFPVIIDPIENKFRRFYTRLSHKVEDENLLEQYLNIIDRFHPDVIHVYGTESDFGLIASKTNIPSIIHIQGNLTLNDLKWFVALSPIEMLRYSKKWLLLKGHGLLHDYLVNKKAASREQKIFKGCKNFMGRTDWDRRISSVLSPGSRYFHCDEMIRSSFYQNEWHPKTSNSDYVIISTIRNNIYKGLETIMQCKIILHQAFPDQPVTWKIAGLLEEYEISYLVEKKFKTKFKDIGIELLGNVQENDLVNLLLSADLYVHPSHMENSPNSVCEAMLLGLPLITTYTGGTSSLLTDRLEGLLIQDGDPYSLAGAIIELIRNRKFAYSLGANARVRALKRHNPEKIVEDLLNIYSTILLENEKLDKLAI